ncbi:uncharacterized protein [Nicotiana tomentosiformis]|uniref:uncharacterized protein n=1 Tax=Nicotiana tomentosiformis TaxID=4098 RepID=UPI00388CD370
MAKETGSEIYFQADANVARRIKMVLAQERGQRDASVLFDLGSTYSYVSSYFASYMVVSCDSLSASVCVSTPVGGSVVVDHIYLSCVVIIGSLETSVDLILLDMVDFDVIFGMDWLSLYHAILDCHAKTVILAIPGLTRLEWKGTLGHSTSRVISNMNAQRMVEKGCLAYLAYIRDPARMFLLCTQYQLFVNFQKYFL